MAYTDIDKPSDYFNTVLYTGNGGTQSITSLDFQPDWCWFKDRSGTNNHALYDSVRGATKMVSSNANNAESTNDGLTSFNSNGFTLGNVNKTNTGSTNYAAWNWKAGTAFTNDASATGIGSIDSSGSVSTDAGFSIVSYTGTGSVGTVAHGLGVAPKMILFKNRTTASNWLVYHEDVGNTKNLYLDASNAEHDRADTFNDTSPTSSVFTVGTADLNTSGNSIIAYCFNDVQGYSKMGSYVGNGSTDGTYVHLGFKPAFVIIKNASVSQNWYMLDNKRDISNVCDSYVTSDNSTAEQTYTLADFLSNGFKARDNGGASNGSGNTLIYMAFAENPFVTSTGVPGTAR